MEIMEVIITPNLEIFLDFFDVVEPLEFVSFLLQLLVDAVGRFHELVLQCEQSKVEAVGHFGQLLKLEIVI